MLENAYRPGTQFITFYCDYIEDESFQKEIIDNWANILIDYMKENHIDYEKIALNGVEQIELSNHKFVFMVCYQLYLIIHGQCDPEDVEETFTSTTDFGITDVDIKKIKNLVKPTAANVDLFTSDLEYDDVPVFDSTDEIFDDDIDPFVY